MENQTEKIELMFANKIYIHTEILYKIVVILNLVGLIFGSEDSKQIGNMEKPKPS